MIRINVCAEGNDWLFGDLKRQFASTRLDRIEVQVSDATIKGADAWVYLRAGEAVDSPDLSRTVICIHDLYHHDGMYLQNGERAPARHAGGLVLCHSDQRRILADAGIDLASVRVLERPLGALAMFTTRQSMPTEFTVGWIGRAHWRKRLDWLFEIASALPQVRFVLAGKELDQTAVALGCAYFSRGDHGIEDLPAVYHGIDCLLITSGTEAGPLTLFEALACGVPVVSTPVGWAPHFAAKAPEIVRLGDSPEALIEGLLQVRQVRRELFDRRAEISALASHPRLDTWFPQVLTLAAAMVAGTTGSRRSAGDGNPPDRTARSR